MPEVHQAPIHSTTLHLQRAATTRRVRTGLGNTVWAECEDPTGQGDSVGETSVGVTRHTSTLADILASWLEVGTRRGCIVKASSQGWI